MVASNEGPTNITTLNHPGPYPGNSECHLTLHQEPDTAMTFDFLTFDLELSDSCEKDSVQVGARPDIFGPRMSSMLVLSETKFF